MTDIMVIAHDMRSTHNVGSLLRTAEGLGVSKVYLSGYTPYPLSKGDSRLPHMAAKLDRQIAKTALGAEKQLPWEHRDDTKELIKQLKSDGFVVAALEQHQTSVPLHEYKAPAKIALLLGTEVSGLPDTLTLLADAALEIPMLGKKESYNVVQAAAMALFQFRFHG